MIESESLGGFDIGFLAGFFDFVNLFFGVAAGFGLEDLDAFDAWGVDVLVAVGFVGLANFSF